MKESVIVKDKPLFSNLRKFINIIDSFRDIGLQQHISLPRIAVCGDQSSGKSSLLENIVGMDFLPRGSGIVTRRPLELRLVHTQNPSQKPYGIFQIEPELKYTDFDKIRLKIEELTDKVAGGKKGIVDNPIQLTIFSNQCPDLTLIDLPGITRVSIKNSDQQKVDIEKVTTQLVARYCRDDDRTIILAVIPANMDLSTSHALDLARKWDPKGQRTLGVITKIDIMDRGTDAKNVLSNRQIPLKLGYVGIKNRSQEDIINKVKVKQSLDQQDEYFRTHPIYSAMQKDSVGTRSLTKRLTQLLFTNIRKHLPSITKQINQKISECQFKLKELGVPLPKDGKEKIHLLWKLITQYTQQFRAQIKGKYQYNSSKNISKNKIQISGGALIKHIFTQLYSDYASVEYKVTKNVTDSDIEKAITMHQGDSIPGFPSVYAFMYLLSAQLQSLKEPAISCLNEVFEHMRKISTDLIQKLFTRFPSISDQVIQIADGFFQSQKDKAQYILEANIDSEINYLFTNDEQYLRKRTKLIPTKDDDKKQKKGESKKVAMTKDQEPKQKQKETKDGKEKDAKDKDGKQKDKQKEEQKQQKNLSQEEKKKLSQQAKKMFIDELRLRVEHYFKIVIQTVRDIIPKNIGYFLVKLSQENIQYSLYNQIMRRQGLIDELGESPEVTQQRQTTKKTLEVLRKAQMTIKRDPDFEGNKDKQDEFRQSKSIIEQRSQ